MTDLAKLSLDELLSLEHRLQAEITGRRSAEKAQAQKQILELASRFGLAVQFAGGAAPAKAPKAPKAKGSVPAKYRHPQDSELAWTGRGRAPKWVEAWKAQHGSLAGITL